jgi:plasmid stability protein
MLPPRFDVLVSPEDRGGLYGLLTRPTEISGAGSRRCGRATGVIGSDLRPWLIRDLDMRTACEHAHHMSKMVQIRNVPDALHRKLKSRAADSGQTLSDFLLAELERLAARPTRDEMLTRLHGRKRVTLKTPAAVIIREERESA